MRRVVLTPGAELSATRVSLMALTERVHSDGAIPLGRSHSARTEMFFADEVGGLKGECISQMCRCPGSQSWRGGDRWNDCVWVKHCLGRCYCTLNGRLLWQLQ